MVSARARITLHRAISRTEGGGPNPLFSQLLPIPTYRGRGPMTCGAKLSPMSPGHSIPIFRFYLTFVDDDDDDRGPRSARSRFSFPHKLLVIQMPIEDFPYPSNSPFLTGGARHGLGRGSSLEHDARRLGKDERGMDGVDERGGGDRELSLQARERRSSASPTDVCYGSFVERETLGKGNGRSIEQTWCRMKKYCVLDSVVPDDPHCNQSILGRS